MQSREAGATSSTLCCQNVVSHLPYLHKVETFPSRMPREGPAQPSQRPWSAHAEKKEAAGGLLRRDGKAGKTVD